MQPARESARKGRPDWLKERHAFCDWLKHVARDFYESMKIHKSRLVCHSPLQKPVETAQEVLERAAKKGLMKPKAAKPARINSPREKPKHRAQADMSRLRIKETPVGNLSDNEEDRNSLKVDKPRKPRSWHGSAEDVSKSDTKDVVSSIPAPSESAPKKKGKKITQPKPFMF